MIATISLHGLNIWESEFGPIIEMRRMWMLKSLAWLWERLLVRKARKGKRYANGQRRLARFARKLGVVLLLARGSCSWLGDGSEILVL